MSFTEQQVQAAIDATAGVVAGIEGTTDNEVARIAQFAAEACRPTVAQVYAALGCCIGDTPEESLRWAVWLVRERAAYDALHEAGYTSAEICVVCAA